MLEQIAAVRSYLNETETGQRGFLLTGEEPYLEPYEAAREKVLQALLELRSLTIDNPPQQMRLDRVRPLIEERFAILEEAIAVRRGAGLAEAAEAVWANQGYQAMGTIRDILSEMEREERMLLTQRSAESARGAQTTLTIIGVTSLLTIGTVAIASVVTARANAARNQALVSLRGANDALEIQVQERTADLTAANIALRESEVSFRLLFANNPHPMWVFDVETLDFLEVNDAAIEKYGYTHDEFLRMRITDIRPAEDVPRLRDPLEKQPPRLFYSGEWQHQTKDGRIIDVYIIAHELLFYGNRAELVVAHDITERKQLEAALVAERANMEQMVLQRTRELQHERDRTQAILEALSEAVLVADLEGTIQYLNPAAASLLGLQSDTAVGQRWRLWEQTKEQEVGFQMQRAVWEGRIWQGEMINMRSDGSFYDAAITIAPLFDPDSPEQPTSFVSVQRDITLMKAAERLKDQFVSNVSHELRSPISLITLLVGSLEMLYSRMDDTKRIEIIRDIRQHTRVLSDLIGDVLEISRIDSGRITMEQERMNLAGLVREEVIHMLPLAMKKTQQLEVQGIDELWVTGQESQLRQVMRNLLSNAIKYTPDGGQITCLCDCIGHTAERVRHLDGMRLRDVWPGIEGLPPGSWAAVCVVDSGIGIAPTDVLHVFERFYRAQAQGDIPGTGLGLSIAWELVKRHGGYLEVSSVPGEGSRFAVYLPLQERML